MPVPARALAGCWDVKLPPQAARACCAVRALRAGSGSSARPLVALARAVLASGQTPAAPADEGTRRAGADGPSIADLQAALLAAPLGSGAVGRLVAERMGGVGPRGASVLLKACRSSARAAELFDGLAEAGLSHNVFTYTALIGSCARDGQLARATATLARMRAAGVAPNGHTYSALLSACEARGDWQQALALFAAMQSEQVPADSYTYSALIAACDKGGQPDRAFQVYESMLAAGAAPGVYEYNALLAAALRAAQWERAHALYESMLAARVRPDTVTINTLLAACARTRQLGRAERLYAQMRTEGLIPSVITYTTMIDAYGRVQQPEAAGRYFADMRAAGLTPGTIPWTALLAAYARAADGDAGAVHVLDVLWPAMCAEKVAPSVVTYGVLLDCCAKAGRAEAAVVIYTRDMEAAGIAPSEECTNLVIRACASDPALVEGMLGRLTALARRSGAGALEQGTLAAAISALCGAGQADRALRLLSWMRTAGMRPSRKTLLSLVEAAARDAQPLVAWDLYEEIRSGGGELDNLARSELVGALCRAGQLELALAAHDAGAAADARPLAALHRPSLTRLVIGCARAGTATMLARAMDLYAVLKSLPDERAAEGPDPAASAAAARAARAGSAAARAPEGAQGEAPLPVTAATAPLRKATVAPTAPAPAPQLPRPVLNRSGRGLRRGAMPPAGPEGEPGPRGVPTALSASAGAGALAYEALIEAACRAGEISQALAVFDDLKAAGCYISNGTLAFLELSVRRQPGAEWRAYDVAWWIRHQAERRKALARPALPPKACHHVVADAALDGEGEGAEGPGGIPAGGRGVADAYQ